MGSSGERDILLKVLEGLKKADADIFVSTASVRECSKALKKTEEDFRKVVTSPKDSLISIWPAGLIFP